MSAFPDILSGREHYLADGLYASFDGFQIKLRAPRDGGDHCVFIEPSTLDAFTLFVSCLKGQIERM